MANNSVVQGYKDQSFLKKHDELWRVIVFTVMLKVMKWEGKEDG